MIAGKIKRILKIDGVKSRTMHWFVWFLIFMLVCTVVSRGIYAYQMPQVTAGVVERRSISQKITAAGVVEAASEQAVYTMSGIHIKKVLVQEGENVEAGDALFELDMEELLEKQETVNRELTAEKQKLSDLRNQQNKTDKDNQTNQTRADEDYNTAVARQENAVALAQSDYDAAVQELAAYPSFETYLQREQEKSTEYQTLKKAAEDNFATKEAKEAFDLYKQTLLLTQKEAWSDEKILLEKAVTEKERALLSAGNAREDALKAASRTVEDAANTAVLDKSTILEQQNAVTNKEAELKKYQSLTEENGIISSTTSGTVRKILVSAGNLTTEGAAVTLSDTTDGWNFTAVISEEQKKYLNTGDEVTLSFQSGRVKLEQLSIASIQKTEEDTYRAVVHFSGDEIGSGESGELIYTTSPEASSCCVPLSSLYSNGTGNYVLLLVASETILGTEYHVEKRNVVVDEKNEEYASLKDCSFAEDEKIVISADRAISPGDTVRLLEGND